ncbi:bacterial regulatory s, gntR family protein [Paraburkholderia xenovorans LB400]|uniref:Transcriptional regulator, GntR family n=1 Tax=Paraburkholderia xenovorans (strain LB400) TaxID=266265 RepID=Q143U7_PARXL|nr:GntR family transcriptional regulator [Paraburkholderia xenovorans]ABE29392.1 transcriptional regulator, GntR family [Paraburkholderia xenovorans LB400]AIP29995.1 bacterial regulatory s, gntR family protein [Paraburkholderia xenovorans LB400]
MENNDQLELQSIKTKRVFEEICLQIRGLLASGNLSTGDKLPPERDLAIRFNVSRPAVREALRSLEISGIIELKTGAKGGAFIRDGSSGLLTRSMQDLLLLGSLSSDGLLEARELIHEIVVRLACERGEEADWLAIEKNIREIEKLGSSKEELPARVKAGFMFFRLIAQATHNEVLVILIESLSDIVRAMIDQTGAVARPELVAVRWRLLKYLRARDPRKAMKEMSGFLGVVHKGLSVEPAPPRARARAAATSAKAPAARTPRAKSGARTGGLFDAESDK